MTREAIKAEITAYLQHLSITERYDDELQMSIWDENPFIYDLSVTRCTSSAMLVALKFGGTVHGYYVNTDKYIDNFTEEAIEKIIGFDCFGHDFCVVDNILVDYWAKEVNDPAKRWIIDLNDPADMEYFTTHYFPAEYWEMLPLWEQKGD